MVEYSCDKCGFSTIISAHYARHLKTKKHEKSKPKSKSKVSLNGSHEYTCENCGKVYKHKQSLCKHIKLSCNKDADVQELLKLLNSQLEQQNKELETKNKQIEKLMSKLQINNNIIIQNNIQLLPYNNSDLSHLTEQDYISCLKKVNFCVKQLIEKVHFNPNKPENMNIYISNIKNRYIMIYDGSNWTMKNKNTELMRLYEDKEIILEEWLEENKYPELKDKFIKYLNNKENDDTMNMIKEEIKLMMYNNKLMIES